MFKLTYKLAAAGAALCVSVAALADDSALLDLLVKKGLISDQESAEVRSDLAKSAKSSPINAVSGGKHTAALAIAGRIQMQFAGLATDIDGTNSDPVSTSHFFLRRIYLGIKAKLGDGWSSSINYDFAGSTFDEAKITWTQSDALALDIGFRKVPFGLEEWYTSSGSLKAIERSPGTRYFVEGNNGRRLGAGSYRTGVYVGGKSNGGIFYNVAVTNPERDESASGVTSGGSASNNSLAYWGNVGFKGKSGGAFNYTLSGSIGFLPDQGGKTLGVGDNLTVYNLFADLTNGPFDLQLEFFGSSNDHGASSTSDSSSTAFSVQPAYKVNDKLEVVARYSYVDSNGRGVSLSDGIRSAPSGGTMDKMDEWYLGFSYFFRGNDVKWQLGYILGHSDDTITGGSASAQTTGIRSQMQVNF